MQDGETTFAPYLAQVYMAKKGFRPGCVSEAAELEKACDIVITQSDGYTLRIVCIVDREARPDARFQLFTDHVEEIGRHCLAYTGSVNGAKMPVVIEIVEIAGQPPDAADIKRLSRYRRRWGKVRLSAWHLAPATGAVWTNALFNRLLAGRELRDLMHGPRLAAEELDTRPVAVQPPKVPIVALSVLVLLAAAFAAEQVFGIGPSTGALKPTMATLVALGGLNHGLVLEQGQWYRLLTAALLHGDAIHLLMNGIALYYAGTILERLVGRAWFAALFVLGALAGSMASLAINPPNVVSVGASGAIMALLAAAYVTSFRMPHGGERTGAQINLTRILIPALIPLASRGGVDFAAHFGGAVAGALTGALLLRHWTRTDPLPHFRKAAAGLAMAGMIGFAGASLLIARGYQEFTVVQVLIPPGQLPKTDEAATASPSSTATLAPSRLNSGLRTTRPEGNPLRSKAAGSRLGWPGNNCHSTASSPLLERISFHAGSTTRMEAAAMLAANGSLASHSHGYSLNRRRIGWSSRSTKLSPSQPMSGMAMNLVVRPASSAVACR